MCWNSVPKYNFAHNICTDSVCDLDNLSDFEMNCNSNHRIFIRKIEERRWKINDTYIDHYRMPDPYLNTMLRKGFFKNWKKWLKAVCFIVIHTTPIKYRLCICHSLLTCLWMYINISDISHTLNYLTINTNNRVHLKILYMTHYQMFLN